MDSDPELEEERRPVERDAAMWGGCPSELLERESGGLERGSGSLEKSEGLERRSECLGGSGGLERRSWGSDPSGKT